MDLGFDKNDRAGFTLLEILIAIFIFAIVVTTVLGSYRFVFHNAGAMDRGTAQYDMAQNCLERMVRDLTAIRVALPPEYSPPDFNAPPDPCQLLGDSDYVGGGEFSNLRFTSREHISFDKNPLGGIARIIYYVLRNDAEQYELRRSDTLFPYGPFEENENDPLLCENITSLQFQYLDAEGTAFETWDSDSDQNDYATPRAVTIRLELGDDQATTLFQTTVALPVWRPAIE